jgi:hypothetical protein
MTIRKIIGMEGFVKIQKEMFPVKGQIHYLLKELPIITI